MSNIRPLDSAPSRRKTKTPRHNDTGRSCRHAEHHHHHHHHHHNGMRCNALKPHACGGLLWPLPSKSKHRAPGGTYTQLRRPVTLSRERPSLCARRAYRVFNLAFVLDHYRYCKVLGRKTPASLSVRQVGDLCSSNFIPERESKKKKTETKKDKPTRMRVSKVLFSDPAVLSPPS